MRYFYYICVLLLSSVSAFGNESIDFNRDVRPILSDKCFACHGPDENTRESGLRFDEKVGLFATLKNGSTMIVPGDPEASVLIQRITHSDPEERMPPTSFHLTLKESEIETLVQWISDGAPWQGHWAFIPPTRPDVPSVQDKNWAQNNIDLFIQQRLESEGFSLSPMATKETLIRRVTLDLTGLPPTPGEVEAYLNDTSASAYEKVVDRLMASTRYGEHMALTWLEASRYADTDGYQNDRLRFMHVWRDWLIESLNNNKPYDEFVIEQLAGDMLPNATLRQQIATGFTRANRINSENGAIPEEWLVENIVDRVDTVGTLFLGLTMSCVRCHDHKYDPISQREYYRMFAHFNRVPEWGVGPNDGNSPPFIEVPKSWPNLSPEEDRAITPGPLVLSNEKYKGVMRPQLGGPTTIMIMQEMEEPRPTYLLQRGQYNLPDKSEVLEPGVPMVLHPAGTPEPANRLELARWLTSDNHPLMSRVTVNRYWQHFFGTGIVESVENFGLQGDFPTHPKLLDWLAREFIRLDWDVKAFQKLLVMSSTYRQSSITTPEMLARDPENTLLARGPRLRLSGQQLRDQALFVSGLLHEQIGGPSVMPYMPPRLWESVSNEVYNEGGGIDLYRRSLYTYWRRTTPPPTMTNFNAADREICSVRTIKTNSPLQALTLMNNITFVESSRHLAERMMREESTIDQRIRLGFRSITARLPQKHEVTALSEAYQSFYEQFQAAPQRAEALLHIGDSPHSTLFDPVELASMSMVASAILNLDEAIMRN